MKEWNYEAIGNLIFFILIAACGFLTGAIVAEMGQIIIEVLKVGIIWI